jgi:hypothetical protein
MASSLLAGGGEYFGNGQDDDLRRARPVSPIVRAIGWTHGPPLRRARSGSTVLFQP